MIAWIRAGNSYSEVRRWLAWASLVVISGLFLVYAGASPTPDWPQWGGPSRNFTAESKGLANTWPANGPRRLWTRNLGDGYSAIAVEQGKLYTMYRRVAQETGKVDQDVVISMDANTGKTLWEYSYDAPFDPKMKMENGPGPHVTPLVAGNRLFTVGVMGVLLCLDKGSGKVLWSIDLQKKFNAPVRGRGYSSSPLAYRNTVIVPAGGPGQFMMAFNQKDGTVAWKKQDLEWGPSSPIIINVDGQDQLVMIGANEIAGMDPDSGDLLWTHPHKTQYGLSIMAQRMSINLSNGLQADNLRL